MNQPRYNDSHGSASSWNGGTYPANRRSVANHSTGRSNYGGSNPSWRGGNNRNSNNNNNQKGGIGKWIQNRRNRRRQRPHPSGTGMAVGTEANAIQNMENNAKHFDYPPEGFITPIEHSLLYAMIEFPERYPESVVKNEIEEEEFEIYLYVNDTKRKSAGGSSASTGGQEDNGDGSEHSSHLNSEGEERVSYAQLSALAALSATKNPSTATPDEKFNPKKGSAKSPNRSQSNISNGSRSSGNGNNNRPTTPPNENNLSVGQSLVRKLLKTITRYSDANGLDRQHEIREFLTPIEKRCQIRNEKAALQQLLPAYAGYTLSLVTGNPLPLLIGAAALTQPDPMVEENSNVSGFRAVGGRAGDMETTGLLDECESD